MSDWSDPASRPLDDINDFAAKERAKALQTFAEQPQVRSVHESLYELTGLRTVWMSDSGSDGPTSWLYRAEQPGYIRCNVCEIQIRVEVGSRSAHSPWQRCPHLLRANL